jgi:D-tyrosyl-tRNA(Tyr) deacylase
MGLLVLLGIKAHDSAAVTQKLCDKIISLRVFDDSAGNMNLDIQSVGGSVLVVPNFTLAADTSRGNRPGFSTAMSPDKAEPLFELFMKKLQTTYPKVKQGIFGTDMQVHLVNDGPITISLETKNP